MNWVLRYFQGIISDEAISWSDRCMAIGSSVCITEAQSINQIKSCGLHVDRGKYERHGLSSPQLLRSCSAHCDTPECGPQLAGVCRGPRRPASPQGSPLGWTSTHCAVSQASPTRPILVVKPAAVSTRLDGPFLQCQFCLIQNHMGV